MNWKTIQLFVLLVSICFFSCNTTGSNEISSEDVNANTDTTNAGGDQVQSHPDKSENFTFEILQDGTAVVTGVSELGMKQSNLDIPSNISVRSALPSSRKLAGKSDTGVTEAIVTSIGDGAFEGCESVTTVHIPNTVVSIGGNAFKNCSSLENVNIPYGLTQINAGTFDGCSSLESISLSNVTDCDSSAFANCDNLKSVFASETLIKNSPTLFENGNIEVTQVTSSEHFRYSKIASEYIIIEGLTDQGMNLETILIPSAIDGIPVKSIGYSALEGSKVKKLIIPDSFDTIPVYGCQYIDTLEEVYLPNTIKKIETYAFEGDTALKKVVMQEGLEYIDTYAFLECSSLRNVELPYSVKKSMIYAFLDCPIESMIISDETDFDAWAFDESKISYKPSKYIYDETDDGIVIKGVNQDIFGSVQGEFVFPEKLKGKNIIEIADNSDFSSCGFTNIIFPSTIKKIGSNSFANCTQLHKVKLYAETEVADNAFSSNTQKRILGDSTGKGSVSSSVCIFDFLTHKFASDSEITVDGLKWDYIQKMYSQMLSGKLDLPIELFIPYEIDGIPVKNVMIENILHQFAHFLHDLDEYRVNHGVNSSEVSCIIYLPVGKDKYYGPMNVDYKIQHEAPNAMMREGISSVLVYTYYCPELDRY